MKCYLIFLTLIGSVLSAAQIPSMLQKIADYPYSQEKPVEEEKIFPLEEQIDFNKLKQDFILETKKIQIPEHPHAFNPSIIRWKGQLLMSFRCYDPKTRATNPIGLVWLDENFEPISTPQIFEFPFHNPVLLSKQQDPRLIAVNGRLFLVYNNIKEDVIHREMRRMFIVELFESQGLFTSSQPECLLHFENENEMRYEKNWVPFEYNGELLLAYSIIPHRIMRPLEGTHSCETLYDTRIPFTWDWGVPRGGTQALLDKDHYLSFFHSWKDIPTVQSNGKKITHYVLGAYIFENKPPFSILAVSPEPIVADNFYEPPYYRTWKPLRCVFPAGILLDEEFVWITYGRQDHELWVTKIDKKKLLQSLIPLSQTP